jgi:DNA-binding beta-propeller fold protein YncE
MTRSAKSKGRPARQKGSPLTVPLVIIAVVLIGVIGWAVLSSARGNTAATSGPAAGSAEHGQSGAEMPHVHGLGFSADGRQLFVAAHDGLVVFADGVWSTPGIPAHDYMGYSPVDTGFYSSGHPHTPGLINPFGLVKSTDGGKTLAKLSFEGESDFHIMGVGYKSHAIYVLNPAPNSRLSAGLHYSLDDGKTWKQSAMQGVTAQPLQIAVHPTDPNIVALATEGGLLLSSNAGAAFERIGAAGAVTAAAFGPDGTKLVFGGNTLAVYDLATRQVTALSMPKDAGNDAVSAITINPVRPDELAVATFERNMYLSRDGGQSWTQIARAGQGISIK